MMMMAMNSAMKICQVKDITTQTVPCAWPPRSKVVKVMPAIVSSSEASRRHLKKGG